MLLCAFVLWKLTNRINVQYRHYKTQLVESAESGIRDNLPTGVSDWMKYLYFAFPVYDLLVRVYIELTLRIR